MEAPPTGQSTGRDPAPGRLLLVQEFVNTYDAEPDVDDLGDLDALASWLRERGLIGAAEGLQGGDLERARGFREALRTLLEDIHEGRTPADNQTVRNVFVIGPDKKVKLIIVYPMTTGRNFDEVLRVLDSLQLTAKHKVATPVNWKRGEDVIIAGSVSDDEARKVYPQGWKAPRPWLRIVPEPER